MGPASIERDATDADARPYQPCTLAYESFSGPTARLTCKQARLRPDRTPEPRHLARKFWQNLTLGQPWISVD